MTNTLLVVEHPCTYRILLVHVGGAYERGEEITPALSHPRALSCAQAHTIRRPACQTDTQTMRELMDDDPGIKRPIAVRIGSVPEEHPAVGSLPVGRGRKVGVVYARAVLRVDDDCVVLLTDATEVECLEVAGGFVETVSAAQILMTGRRREENERIYGREETHRWYRSCTMFAM